MIRGIFGFIIGIITTLIIGTIWIIKQFGGFWG